MSCSFELVVQAFHAGQVLGIPKAGESVELSYALSGGSLLNEWY